MVSDAFLLQLFASARELAQLKEPFLVTMDIATHPWGGTAHESQDHHTTPAAAGPLVCRVLTRVSHTGSLQASPPATPRQTPRSTLGYAAAGSRAAVDDLVLRRFPAGTLRDRSGLLRRPTPQAAAAGADGPRLSEGPRQGADA